MSVTRHFQIELLSNGIEATALGEYTWKRSGRILYPDRFPNSVVYLETVHYSDDPSGWPVALMDPDGVAVDVLSLPQTSVMSSNLQHNYRKRSTTPVRLTKSGVYKIRTGAIGGTGILYDAGLYVEQTNPRITEEHRTLLIAPGSSSGDSSGISGTDIYRTLSTSYAPAMSLTAGSYDEGGSEKLNFVWFKYVAAEWPDLSYCQIEINADGFADISYAALYKVDPTSSTQTFVTGSEVSKANGSGSVFDCALSGAFTLPSDGYYALRVKSSNGAANAFYASAFLRLVSARSSSGRMRGRTFWRIGTGERTRNKKLPSIDGTAMFETCTFKNNGQSTDYIYATSNDIGIGSSVAASAINQNAAYAKGVFRSAGDISGDLVAGNRFDGDNNSGIGIESTIAVDYDFAVSSCDCPDPYDFTPATPARSGD